MKDSKELQTNDQSQMLPATVKGADQARAIAEVQASIIVAKAHPRDEMFCHTQIMKSCERKSLAEKAIYAYRRGSTLVSGPSIALAETIARHWGNINYGFREISREKGYSEVESFAHDIQTNTKVSRTFKVKHWRDTQSGGYALKEERDIYEIVANMAQRRVRACLLEIVPRDIVDDAEQACNKTLVSDDKPLDQQIKDMLVAFDGLGVTQENVEEYFQRSIKSIIPADLVKLRQIHTSIKNGVARREDFFDLTPKAGEDLNNLVGKSIKTAAKDPVVVAEPEPAKDDDLDNLGESDGSEGKGQLSAEEEERQSSTGNDTKTDDDLDAMTSEDQDHPFNRTKWISMRSAGALQIFVKNHAESWETTTQETKQEFYDKWKRILKAGAVESWPFEDMEAAPKQEPGDDDQDQVRSCTYIAMFNGCENKESLKACFLDNNATILNNPDKDIIIAEYDKLMDANEKPPELKTTKDFLNFIYHATKAGDLSRLQMVHAETIDALPEKDEIWNRVDEKLNELNQAANM